MSSPKSSSKLTKEELRNALIRNGFNVPAAAAKKEEFQKLYDEKVLPLQGRSEFSSDDEQDSAPLQNGSSNGTQSDEKRKKEDWEQSVKNMTNEQLYMQLQRVGIKSGPVVDSTRQLYESQLLAKIGHPLVVLTSRSNGDNMSSASTEPESEEESSMNGRNGYSDSDDDVTVETASRASRSSRGSNASPRKRGINKTDTPLRETANSSAVKDSDASSSSLKRRPQRRSETPRNKLSDISSSVPQSTEEIRSIEREERRRSEIRSMFSSDAGISGGVSYFKERPGYASTTTSNVLPSKPTAPQKTRQSGYLNEQEENANVTNARKGTTIWFILFSLLLATAVGILGYYLFTLIDEDQSGQAVDELEEILKSIEEKDH